MSYCKIGDKPKVFYKFANKTATYETDKAPIDVEIKPYDPQFNGGQCPVLYRVDAYIDWVLGHYNYVAETPKAFYSGIVKGGVREIPTIYPEKPIGGFVFYNYQFNVIGKDDAGNDKIYGLGIVAVEPDRQTFASGYSYNYVVSGAITGVTRLDKQPDNCGDPKKSVQIIVYYQNQEIFSDYGDAPASFSVACEGCPEGTIRCEQSGYPGYCCLPCDPIAQRINNLAARIK